MKNKDKTLCPNCQSKDKWIESRIVEEDGGFRICGMCKGKGWVFTKNESYSTVKSHWLTWRRSGMDVVRIVGIEQEDPEFDYERFAEQNNTKFLGFTHPFKTIAQNDVNYVNY